MKYFLYSALIVSIVMFLSACGDDGRDGLQGDVGPQGLAGPSGDEGEDGEDALAELETLVLEPSRDYDPSTFSPETVTRGPGVFSLPEELPMTGSAGTGWASITVNDTRFCYQGDGNNNSDLGTKFVYDGAFELPGECFSASLTDESLEGSSFLEDMEITAEVHGGGVSSGIRTETTIEAEIMLRELN